MIPELLNGVILLSPTEGWEAVTYSFSLLRPLNASSVNTPVSPNRDRGRNRWQSLLFPLFHLTTEDRANSAEECLSLLITIVSHAPTVEERVILRGEIKRAGLSEMLQVSIELNRETSSVIVKSRSFLTPLNAQKI